MAKKAYRYLNKLAVAKRGPCGPMPRFRVC